jgi:hypothetical protein
MRTEFAPGLVSAAYHTIQKYQRLASILRRHRGRLGELRFSECLASIKRRADACPAVQELRRQSGAPPGILPVVHCSYRRD